MTGISGNGGNATDFLAHIEHLLADPAGTVTVTSGDIFAHVDNNLLNGLLKHASGEKPSVIGYIKDVVTLPTQHSPSSGAANAALGTLAMTGKVISPLGAMVGLAIGHNLQMWKYAKKRRHIAKAAPDFTISRAAIGLRENERAALRGMAALRAENKLDWPQWSRFYCQLAWAGGQAEVTPPSVWASSIHIDDARKFLNLVCGHVFPDHSQFIALAASDLGKYANDNSPLGCMIQSIINAGARWLTPDDIGTSKTFKMTRTPASLQIGGFRPGQQPLFFDGNESLATVAGAGTGKSAAQVVPNLLTYPGSCFVLDVKGELWEQTAGYRARTFGPVYRFAPTDASGQSHRYNPFDVVPQDAAGAERECQVIASMIIPDQPGGARDPFWDEKAREYLWAFCMAVAFLSKPGFRHLGSVSRLFSIPTSFADMADYHTSETKVALDALKDLAGHLNIPALKQASNAIYDTLANEKLLQSVLDTARAKLNPLTRSPTALAAMTRSDWTPLDLRRRPGTTVYFCLKPDDMRAYAPLVRLVFQQHVAQLTRNFTPKKGELPVTFFLDEMPQLGYMPNMTDLIDIGRGAGVRLWMFMQFMSQIRDVYQVKGAALIEACRVRSYMSPDTEAARAIEPLLGEVRNIFSGEKKPLAYTHELAGREYEDDIVVVARGEHPARLAKLHYFKDPTLITRARIPPPHVTRLALAAPATNHQQHIGTTAQLHAKPARPPLPRVQHVRDPVIRPRNS